MSVASCVAGDVSRFVKKAAESTGVLTAEREAPFFKVSSWPRTLTGVSVRGVCEARGGSSFCGWCVRSDKV